MKKLYFLFFFLSTLISFKAICLPALSSFPTARATIFLDFDGHFVHASSWNGGNSFYCAPSGFNDAQITEVFNRVAEDYRPFNINITTDSTVFLAAPLAQRVRMVVTTTSSWYLGVGGVSYTGSFTWGDDTPGFVFVDRLAYSPKIVAECCSHESGHTLGLSHQAKYDGSCALITTYNEGTGSGQIGWAPVMGNSYYKNVSGWNNGPTPNGCTADQDNLSIITSRNGFTYRMDDHSDDPKVNPTSVNVKNVQFATSGIISTNTDKDAFKFDFTKQGILHLDAQPFSVGADNAGANLDVKVTLLNSYMQVVRVYDPENILNVSIDTILNQGTYYVIVEGAGNINSTNYGSLGSYTVSGNFTPMAAMPVSQVVLFGKADQQRNHLEWNIITDTPVKELLLESSSDGTIFTSLTTFYAGTKDFNFEPLAKGTLYYRLKVTSVNNQVMYSNIVAIKASDLSGKPFTVSTLTSSEIKIVSAENYKYQLADMSGRVLKSGSGDAGSNQININNCPNGIYFIQIISNSQRTTQRILKL
jgi:hypothetical protein